MDNRINNLSANKVLDTTVQSGVLTYTFNQILQ